MARKKKAPAIKSNLRDVPADKFRAVNRMNGIVTMVEYTSEDDIKAYELEPTYQEIGGGGGIDNPVLTINVVATGISGEIGALPLLQINDNDLRTFTQLVVGGTTTVYSTIVLDYYQEGESAYVWDSRPAYPPITGTSRTLSVSNEVNCTVALDQGEGQFYAMITDPTQPASFTLTIS